jgi:lipid A 3-O-deacylase
MHSFGRFPRIFASLLLLLPTAAVALAQPAPSAREKGNCPLEDKGTVRTVPFFAEPVPVSRFETIPPVPFVWGVPVEPVPEEAYPVSPAACVAESFAKHQGSLQLLGGAYFCPVGLGPRTTPGFNFAPIDVRLGCMIYSPCPDDCCLRGNVEAILELTTAPIFRGSGSIIIGPTALLRYNFIQPDWRLVPYLQGGGGFTYNDAYRDKTQRALGQAGEFYLQATGGVHFLLHARCSLDIEGGYVHISNAGTNDRNGGINALGGSVGVTYFFGN